MNMEVMPLSNYCYNLHFKWEIYESDIIMGVLKKTFN